MTTIAKTVSIASTGALLAAAALVVAGAAPAASTKTVSIKISGGHKTVASDKGRPVVLVAGALGVKPSVFRKAFSGVHPAGQGSGGPTSAEAQANKQALLKVLGPYGITNDQIDAASNKYRYNDSAGEMWPTTAAKGIATIRNGKVVSVKITKGGAGYTSKPAISVPGYSATLSVKLHYGKSYSTNGSIKSVTVK